VQLVVLRVLQRQLVLALERVQELALVQVLVQVLQQLLD
jgi:hypothetical protein